MSPTALLTILLSLPSGAVGQQIDPSEATRGETRQVDVQEIKGLIEDLGDSRFATRQAATRRLRELGRVALPTLKAAADHPDAEVRQRIRGILEWTLGTTARRAFISEPTLENARKVPGWDRFARVAGDGERARKDFASMLNAEPLLFEALLFGGDTLQELLRERTRALTGATAAQRSASLHRVLAILFVSADPETRHLRITTRGIDSLVRFGNLAAALSGRGASPTARAVVGHWIEHPDGSEYEKLMLALNHGLVEGLAIAERTITERGRGARLQYSLHLIARVGSRRHTALVESLLDDDTALSGPREAAVAGVGQTRPRSSYHYEVRDVALATLWHLHGQDPRQHGFKRARVNTRTVFALDSLGFQDEKPPTDTVSTSSLRTADQQRRDALTKWQTWKLEQGGDKS